MFSRLFVLSVCLFLSEVLVSFHRLSTHAAVLDHIWPHDASQKLRGAFVLKNISTMVYCREGLKA